ncbi:cupin domain-containing protein [Desulfuromonas acetexigens]|uniref:Cupin domain-containing protein n=1 Tax=Trichloromonas acetexigens TaxID=38815 RepID=A0A550JIZ4_9BACT|nr:cupin domain-containing protein [Desulfuromonas acetexigens]TRO83184.1 cupin domain-containing protein [Desulfuromonas acetexigens]
MPTFFHDYTDKVAYNKEQANKIILAETPHSRTTLWCLLPGQHIHPHVHAGDHIWVILEGTGRFLGDSPHDVEPGTVVVAPEGVAHGIDNTGGDGLVFVSISAG